LTHAEAPEIRQKANQVKAKSYIAALDDSDPISGPLIRRAAAVALGNLDARAAVALPRLTRLVREEDNEWVKIAAVEAIRQITESDSPKR